MLKRFLLRSLSLILAGLLLACFAHLIWNGWHATEIVGENIPYPRLSSPYRDIDLWHPSASFGRIYDLIFWPAGPGVKPMPSGAHLKIQLASNGRTRLLVVRKGHPNTDVSWLDILLGRERLQVVANREWIDLGPLPEGEERLDYQITGLLREGGGVPRAGGHAPSRLLPRSVSGSGRSVALTLLGSPYAVGI